MDPAAITASVVREVARDGNFGAHAHDVWKFAAQAAGQPLDDTMKDSVWLWLAQHPAVRVERDRIYASEDLQWLELTGGPRQGNIVPQLAFNVLCAVAHSREAGISTVDVARQVGQDPRSLFGRVQLLADLGLVQRFPVIEKGSSTHRIVLSPYISLHTHGQSAGDQFIDKQSARKQIVEFCESGPQGLRLKRDVVSQMGNKLTSNSQRRRPLVISLLRDLETRGFVRSVQVVDPAAPSRAFACVQFVKSYEVEGPEKSSNSAWTDTTIDLGEEAADGDEPNPEDIENEKDSVVEHGSESVDLSRAVASEVTATENVQANTVLPLASQIHDMVFSAGAQGVSAMDLTRRLTGKSYSKALGKYLDAITGVSKSKSKPCQPAELGNLSLIKGVDFAQRVKFYRYFTRVTYPGGAIDEKWGSFSDSPAVRDPTLSLKILDSQSKLPLPGLCSIIETQNGEIRPLFHGEKGTVGKTLLVSDPSRAQGPTSGAPPKRRGRPPKNAPRPPPTVPEDQKPKEPAIEPLKSVRLMDRQWVGGSLCDTENQKPSIWLQRPSNNPQGELNGTKETTVTNNGTGASDKASTNEVLQASGAVHSSESEKPVSTESSLGSLAFKRRLDTLLSIVRENRGAVIGGQDLVDRFNAAVKGDSLVDRKTIDRVTKNLVKQGKLRQIFVNMPTMTGIHLMKYILYDPTLVGDVDSSPLIAELKEELSQGTRIKQAAAAKAAAGSHRLNGEHNFQEMTSEQANAFRPLLGQRLATTSTRKNPLSTRKYGANAGEVASISTTGESVSSGPKRAKRAQKSRQAATQLTPENTEVPQFYGSVAIIPRPAQETAARRNSVPIVPTVDQDWLFRAIVIVRSLFPRGKNIDWGLIVLYAPAGTNEKMLRQQWGAMRDNYHGSVAKRTEEWEDLFVEAYALDEIVFLKPSDPGFTLHYYIDWWRVAEQTRKSSRTRRYGAGDKRRLGDLKLKSQNFECKLLDPLSSLQSQPSMIRSEELLVRTLIGVPLDTEPLKWRHPFKLSDNAAKLRAVIAADDGVAFSAKDAARELESLSEEQAKQALNELERYKYVQWAVSDPEKVPAGRPYVLSDKVKNSLAPPAKLERDLPTKATASFTEMPDNGVVDIQETIDEAQMIPLLEMATLGLEGKHVELQRSGEHSGRLSTHYRSRDIDKGELDCDIRAKVTATAEPRDPAVRKITGPEAPGTNHPYIWQTTQLESHKIWNAVSYRLLATALFRPGITYEGLTYSLRHILEKEEVFAAIDALVSGGALYLENGGLRTAPNWFTYIS